MSPSNFNGTFTFSSIAQYAMGIPSQFSINAGMPAISVRQFDAGLFFGASWRIRTNLTLNIGIRYETQTNIHDHRDIAPRIAWAPRPKTVIRGGVGIFYDRFALANTLTADRFNGVVQQQYVVTDPTFYPTYPPIASLAANHWGAGGMEVDSHLRAVYRSVRRHAGTPTAEEYYACPHLHELAWATHSAAEDVVFSLEGNDPVFLMTSSGLYNQISSFSAVNTKESNPAVSLFGYYVLFNRDE